MKYDIDKQFKPLLKLGKTRNAARHAFLRCFFALTKRKCGIACRKYRLRSFDGQFFDTHTFVPKRAKGKKTPCVVFFHGGAFNTECSIQHFIAHRLAKRLQAKIVMPFYRLAPEYPFPYGFQDCFETLKWVWENADALDVDRTKIAVMGDSAGGNLATAVCLRNRDEKFCDIKFQVLLYPVTDNSMDSESMRKFVDTPVFDAVLNREMWDMYLKNGFCGMKDYALPLQAGDLKNLPPALIELAEFDCLHDQGLEYAKALKSAGNEVTLCETKRTPHGYDGIPESDVAKKCMDLRVALLEKAFGADDKTNAN